MTIGFRMYKAQDGSPRYIAHNCTPSVEPEEVTRAISAIDSTGCSIDGITLDKLPVVVAALRLAGFEVK